VYSATPVEAELVKNKISLSTDTKVVTSLMTRTRSKYLSFQKKISRCFGQLKCPKGNRNNDGYLLLISCPKVNAVKKRLQERKNLRVSGIKCARDCNDVQRIIFRI
jgi:hypothetical protein